MPLSVYLASPVDRHPPIVLGNAVDDPVRECYRAPNAKTSIVPDSGPA